MINLMRYYNKARVLTLSLALIAVMILNSGCATTAQAKASPRGEARSTAKSTETLPANPNTIYRMAKLMLAQGKEAEGELALYNLLRAHPEFTPAYNDLAEINMRQGRPDEASQGLSMGLAISPTDPILLNNAGVCALMKGSFEEALAHFENALISAPREQRFQANAAAALALLGREEESLTAYKRILPHDDAQFNIDVLSGIRENSRYARLNEGLHLFKVTPAGIPEQRPALTPEIPGEAIAETVEEHNTVLSESGRKEIEPQAPAKTRKEEQGSVDAQAKLSETTETDVAKSPTIAADVLARPVQAETVTAAPPIETSDSKIAAEPRSEHKLEITHTVAAGETLKSVSEEYGVELRDIVRWNSLTQWWLEEDQKLTVALVE